MTTKQMQDEVRNYCINLIIKSNISDWIHNWNSSEYIKDNITIYVENNDEKKYKFKIKIYKIKDASGKSIRPSQKLVGGWSPSSSDKECRHEFEIKRGSEDFCRLWDIKKRKIRNNLKRKYFEINDNRKNKKEYDSALEVYELLPKLPIKEARLKKLQNIEKNN